MLIGNNLFHLAIVIAGKSFLVGTLPVLPAVADCGYIVNKEVSAVRLVAAYVGNDKMVACSLVIYICKNVLAMVVI